MLTERELAALLSVLQRCPCTPAEGVAIEMIVNKLREATAVATAKPQADRSP